MKFPFRAWRWNLAATAALACSANSLWAQQPLTGVKVAEPVATSPAAAAQSGKQQPTPAAPPAPASGGEAKDETKAGEPQAPGTPAPLGEEPAASPLTPAPDMPTQDEVVELIKERYPSGAIKVEREVMQDEAGNYLLHGAWRQFDERGRLIIDGRLVKNLKDGLWRRFYRCLLYTSPSPRDS